MCSPIPLILVKGCAYCFLFRPQWAIYCLFYSDILIMYSVRWIWGPAIASVTGLWWLSFEVHFWRTDLRSSGYFYTRISYSLTPIFRAYSPSHPEIDSGLSSWNACATTATGAMRNCRYPSQCQSAESETFEGLHGKCLYSFGNILPVRSAPLRRMGRCLQQSASHFVFTCISIGCESYGLGNYLIVRGTLVADFWTATPLIYFTTCYLF